MYVITYIFRERNRIPKEYAKVKSSHFDLFNFSNVYSFLIRRSLKRTGGLSGLKSQSIFFAKIRLEKYTIIHYKTMIYTIYKLCCDDTDKFYVGSTRNRKERVRRHRDDSKVKDTLINKTIREFGGWDNWRMVDLEVYECDSKREVEKREEELRIQLKAELNTRVCYREKQMVNCECGLEITKYSMSRHLKTQRHLKLMESL